MLCLYDLWWLAGATDEAVHKHFGCGINKITVKRDIIYMLLIFLFISSMGMYSKLKFHFSFLMEVFSWHHFRIIALKYYAYKLN